MVVATRTARHLRNARSRTAHRFPAWHAAPIRVRRHGVVPVLCRHHTRSSRGRLEPIPPQSSRQLPSV